MFVRLNVPRIISNDFITFSELKLKQISFLNVNILRRSSLIYRLHTHNEDKKNKTLIFKIFHIYRYLENAIKLPKVK